MDVGRFGRDIGLTGLVGGMSLAIGEVTDIALGSDELGRTNAAFAFALPTKINMVLLYYVLLRPRVF